jgi:ketosteroid isomerase-like protein
MITMQTLIDLENQGWQALSSEGDAGRNFYASVLHDDAVMIFPGGLLLEGKEQILESLAAQPWKSYEIDAPRTLSLAEDAALLIYKVTSQREGDEPYEALISSAYVLDAGAWKLICHQQTPV